MKKLRYLLLGLILILVVGYLGFLDVSTKIKDDLLSRTTEKLSEHSFKEVKVRLKGQDLTISRVVVLSGKVNFIEEKSKAIALAKEVEGVCAVENNLTIQIPTPVVPKIVKVPKVETGIAHGIKETPMHEEIKEEVTQVVVRAKEINKNHKQSSVVEEIVKVPMVPMVISKTVDVPTPVEVPIAIKVEERKIETKGDK